MMAILRGAEGDLIVVLTCISLMAILRGAEGDLTVVLTCISLMVSDVEHFLQCTYWPFVCLLVKISVHALCPFLIQLFVFCY